MFRYCVSVLHFAESVAYKRIQAARAARRFPVLLEALRRGDLHLTALSLLSPHITAESCGALIQAARHRSAEEVRRLLADRAPRPDVPTSVRRLPKSAAAARPTAPPLAPASAAPRHEPAFEPAPTRRAGTEPLGGERYHVRFTADSTLHAQLRELQALMRHQIPDGDLGKILARALPLLLEQVRKRKFGETATPRSNAPSALPKRSRHIPAAIRRVVASRDGERCTYVSAGGRRCEAREFLEFDHRVPWSVSGSHTAEAIALRCRAHNQMRTHRAAEAVEPVAGESPAQLDSNPVADRRGS